MPISWEVYDGSLAKGFGVRVARVYLHNYTYIGGKKKETGTLNQKVHSLYMQYIRYSHTAPMRARKVENCDRRGVSTPRVKDEAIDCDPRQARPSRITGSFKQVRSL